MNTEHPGDLIIRLLTPMGMTVDDLADELNIDDEYMTGLINKTEKIEYIIALKLGKFFYLPADFWSHLQQSWDTQNIHLGLLSTPSDDNSFYHMINK